MPTIAKINGIAIGSIAKINGIAKANISKVDGVLISAPAWVTPTAIDSKCGEDACCPASNTIDGSLATYWQHNVNHEHWIIFDLGSTKTVQKVRVYCEGNQVTGHLCEVSAIYINDSADESGGSKGSGSIASGTNWNEIDVTDTTGQYIKLKLKTWKIVGGTACVNTHPLYYFYEFEAYV